MLKQSRRTPLTLPLGLAVHTLDLMVSHYAKVPLFGLSNVLLSGLIMGAGIGVVLNAVVSVVHSRKNWAGD